MMLMLGVGGEESNHTMVSSKSLTADAERIREMRNGEQIMDSIEGTVRSLGAEGLMISGIPMPGRAAEPLLLRLNWWERNSTEMMSATDPLFAEALEAQRPRIIDKPSDPVAADSALYRTALSHGAGTMLCVTVRIFPPYQGVVIAAGPSFSLDELELLTLGYFCEAAFGRLLAVRALNPERPGHLSARERGVVGMSAKGMTASDIAKALAISQRTVHAHLQNASDKLRARNKTQTVIEAIRYGQISL
jgi:LuxR family transcriptional regulator, quorum-sensing system regulator BjaR1